ncbi:PKD domain-containing protein, partial [Candidatus Bathyarchaeota archaeon]
MPSYLKARGRTSRAYLIAVLILFLVPGPLLGSHFSSAQAAPATSWNPRIACTPTLATVRDILGSSYPSQSLTGSRYQTSSTAGGLPSKRALSPPCNLSNTNGQTVSSLVQINGVYLSSLITQDCATKYDVVNGGGNYPDRNGDGKPDTYCDSTGNIFQIGTTSGYIHVEIDHDWQAAGYCGTGTFCDNVTLAQYVSSGAISLDVQGLVFWDGVELPGHWELHPFTAFQLSFSTRFTNSPSVPSPGVPASFAATVTGATPPYTFRWDFGDGTTSSGTTTTHTYSSQGNYNVTLTTNDSTGQLTKFSKIVSVRPQGFSFAASGDFGSLTDVTGLYNLKLLQDFNPDFFLGLGDFSYDSSVTGDVWCSQFKSQYNNVQIFPGDHDTGGHPAGFSETHSYEKYVNNCALTLNVPIVCGPVSGACYGKEYYFDYPASNPIARFIFASPKIYNMTGVCTQALEPPGNWPNCSSQTSTGNPGQPCTDAFGCWQYLAGNIHYNWVSGAIDNARSIGIRWVIVGMHKLCISASDATCSMGNAFFNMLLQKKVDLIIQAHDNAYERSKQLALNTSTCQNINNDSSGYAVYTSGCVVDNGSQGFYTAGAGTVVVVQGAWINDLYGVNGSATNSQNVLEAPYFVKLMGRNTPGAGNGFAKYIVYAGGIDVQTNFSGIFQDSFSINKRSSSTAVVCSPSTVNEGQSTTCTATVTDTSPGTPITPTGTITFTSTPNGLLASPLKCTLSASASCSVAFNAPAGSGGTTYTLTASYSGDLNHGTGSGTASVTVGTPPPKHDTSTSVNCSPSSVVVNQATSCNATVTDTAASGAKAPTGTVTFTPSGSCALSSPTTNSASCSVSITPSTVGTTSVTASYGGDSSHNSSSGSTSITANPRLTSTSISCPVSATNGTTVSCTATVADTSPGTTRTPTGTVSWSTNGTGAFSSTTCTLSLGSCSVSYTANSPGFHVINGNYGGDSTHTPSSGQATIRVSLMVHSTTTSVSCTPSSVVVNQAATCTATVTDTASSGQTAPTGTVTFTSSGTGSFTGSPCTLGSPTSNSASCQVTYTPSGVGSHGITGAYGGDANHGSSTSSPVFSLAVTLRTTSTSVSCNPSTVAVGQATSCTATVADTSGTGAVTPIGTVTFTPGGPCTLSGGSCSVDITPSAQGALTVSAGYGGDSVHGTSSGSTIVTVNPPSSNNYTISWQGFDWDGGGEETLTLNGQFLASLPAVDTPQNSNVYVAFSLNTTLVIQGVNRLTFTHANFDCPVTDSVKNLQVENGSAVVYSNSTVEPLSCAESLTYTFTVGGPPPLSASFTY